MNWLQGARQESATRQQEGGLPQNCDGEAAKKKERIKEVKKSEAKGATILRTS
jgi:hypothetical protein